MNSSIESLENQLSNWMHPIQPRGEFVEQLRGRLINPPEAMIESQTSRNWLTIMLSGVLIGLISVWIFRRFTGD